MKNKFSNPDKRLYTLFSLVIVGSSIQLTKNAKLAYMYQGYSFEFIVTFFALCAITLLIIFNKVKFLNFGKKAEITFLFIEILLSILAVLCCCCLDECKQWITIEKIDAAYFFKCCYTVIGIFGCLIISTILSNGIDNEISRVNMIEKIINYRNFINNRLQRIRNKISNRK